MSNDQITHCQNEEQADYGPIRHCVEGTSPDYDAIRHCPDEPQECDQATQVEFAEPIDYDCAVDDQYRGQGGTGRYQFSMTGGVIGSESGIVQSLTPCVSPGDDRTGTITVTDGCTSRTIEVRLNGGTWTQTAAQSVSPVGIGVPGLVQSPPPCSTCGAGRCNGENISGGTRITEQVGWGPSGSASIGTPVTQNIGTCGFVGIGDSFPSTVKCGTGCVTNYVTTTQRVTYRWQCP